MDGLDLLELGLVLLGLAVLARLAGRFGVSTIPLYLIAALAFGQGGLLPLVKTRAFVGVGAEIGLILLLFMLGLEYSARELTTTLRSSRRAGLIDLALNFPPGFLAGLAFGWGVVPAAFLGGVTYVSSSGVAAKLLHDLGRMRNRETPVVVSVLVLEDLAMALYLPVLAILVADGDPTTAVALAVGAVAGVIVFLLVARRVDVGLSRLIFSHSDEALLLSILGFAVVVAGIAQLGSASAAVGALLAGIAVSGPAARSARNLLAPLRDLFAAIFFAFVGLSVDPATLPVQAVPAFVLAALTAGGKVLTGWWSARRLGVDRSGRLRAGTMLIARGEFSIAIAGLGVAAGLAPRLASLTVAYVIILAIAGPLIARFVGTTTPTGDGVTPAERVRVS
jgi:monovalent cation:H+ antiporter-2, CPA2 family